MSKRTFAKRIIAEAERVILPQAEGTVGPTGPAGPTGATGPAGPGVSIGGTTGQVLEKASNTDYDTAWVTQTLDSIDAPVASVDFADQQALSFRIENRTSDPGTPTEGQIWLRTDL